MKIIEVEKVVTTTTKAVLQRVVCDKCGNPDVGTESPYDVFECELKIEEGSHYPEGRDVTTTTMDLCQQCTQALKKLLTDNGYTLNESR